ncbi:MAG: type II toxin-antitoxin system VapC family toxin [Myxococcota bacterium]
MAQRCRAARIQLVPIMPTHSFRVIELPFHHRDPFDRMIVAQALEEGWTVLTHDRVIPSYGVSYVY